MRAGLLALALVALCDRLDLSAEVEQLCPDRNWHDALYDAIASLVLLRKILKDTGEDLPLATLQRPDRGAYFARRYRK